MVMNYVLRQVTQDRYDEMQKDNAAFLAAVGDPSKDTVGIYRPRNEKMLAELELIRELSTELMLKKDEDLKKAAQAAEEIKEEKSEDAEEKPETEETEQDEKKE